MDKIETEVPTDLLADLLMASGQAPGQPEGLLAKAFAVMALTSLLTFGALVGGYHLFFSHPLFA